MRKNFLISFFVYAVKILYVTFKENLKSKIIKFLTKNKDISIFNI